MKTNTMYRLYNMLNKILCVGFCCFFLNDSHAQEGNSLEILASKKVLLKDYVQWSHNYGSQKVFDSANKYSKKALWLEKEINDKELSAYVYLNHARMLYWQAKASHAHEFIDKNLEHALVSDSIKVKTYLLKAEILAYEQDQKEAMQQAMTAHKLVLTKEKLDAKDSLHIVDANLLMAHIQKNEKNFKQAIYHYDEAFLYCSDLGMATYIQFYKAKIFADDDTIEKAIDLVKEALFTAKVHDLKIYIPTYYLALSDYYLQLKKPDSALYYSKLGLIDNTDCHLDGLYHNLGMGYLQLGDATNAILSFEDALQTEISEMPKATIYKNLSNAHRENGNLKQALYYNDIYLRLHDSISAEETKQQIFEISEKYQSDKRALEIDLLKTKAESNELVISKQKRILIFSWVCLLLSLLLLFFILKYYFKQKKQRVLLFEKNLQLAQKLEQISSQQHKRMAAFKKSSEEIDSEMREAIIVKIETLIAKQFYQKKDTSLASVAKAIETNTTYLSKIINESFNKPFTHFVNDLRIEYLLQKLESDASYSAFTIEYIAEDIGFASSSAFYNAFKKHTGLTPSYYIKKRLHFFKDI